MRETVRALFKAPLVHVEVSLEDALLEGIGLLGRPRLGRVGRRGGHVRNRPGSVMMGVDDSRRPDTGGATRWGSAEARAERERGSGPCRNGALGTRPKLLGPVEALV